ncbi:MAG: MAPEG family protein [Pseudomonadota bacterium]|nr:MAPEG family protein [Pseudomonadota bacterium]
MDKTLLYPIFAQVILTFIVGILTFRARVKAVKQLQVAPSYFKHNRGKAPESMMRWTDNYQNQFELPVLFYTLVALLIITEISNTLFIIGAWVFVLTRLIHTFVHVRNNHILYRMRSFVAGFFILLAMWIGFIFQIINT